MRDVAMMAMVMMVGGLAVITVSRRRGGSVEGGAGEAQRDDGGEDGSESAHDGFRSVMGDDGDSTVRGTNGWTRLAKFDAPSVGVAAD